MNILRSIVMAFCMFWLLAAIFVMRSETSRIPPASASTATRMDSNMPSACLTESRLSCTLLTLASLAVTASRISVWIVVTSSAI